MPPFKVDSTLKFPEQLIRQGKRGDKGGVWYIADSERIITFET